MTETTTAASAILLARTSLDIFTNEYIYWRRLEFAFVGLESRELPLPKKIQIIRNIHGCSTSKSHPLPVQSLKAVHKLRNLIVHFDPSQETEYDRTDAAGQILVEFGILSIYRTNRNWHDQLLTSRVAQWTCSVVGAAVIALEHSTLNRVRVVDVVERQVTDALRPLPYHWDPKELK